MKKNRLGSVIALVVLASLFSVSNVHAQESTYDLFNEEITNQLEVNKKLKEGTLTSDTLKQLKGNSLNSLKNTQSLNKFNRINSVSNNEDGEILVESEYNGDFDSANTTVLEQGIFGQFLPMYDIDIYKVQVPASGLLLVAGATNSSAIDLLFGAVEKDFMENGNLEYLGYEYEDDVEYQYYKVNKGGTYYIPALDYDYTIDYDDNTEDDIYGIMTAFIDNVAPAQPSVNAVYDNATSITGKAESNAKVYAMVGSQKIGEATANSGAFTIKITKQKAGTSISLYAVDTAGNKSSSKIVKVIDKTAPSVPTVNAVYDNATVITGKAESNAKVYAMVGSKKIGEATANSGAFTIKITKQEAGTSISLYAVDTAGNKSSSKIVKVIDKTAPVVPTVNKITSKTVTATGKGEKGATIYIYNGSKKIGQGIVDSGGNYKVKIKVQKKGSTLKVYAQDKSGNKSKSNTVKVS